MLLQTISILASDILRPFLISGSILVMKQAIVYVPMSADIIHPGHIQVLQEAMKHGQVIIGLLSDNAIKAKKGNLPVMNYNERFIVVNHLKGVHKVIEQKTPDYRPNLLKNKADFCCPR
jgi:phosphoenolpyruvate phosphomutase / 2-hydroxyethylphosphonate cytidylyltransferase